LLVGFEKVEREADGLFPLKKKVLSVYHCDSVFPFHAEAKSKSQNTHVRQQSTIDREQRAMQKNDHAATHSAVHSLLLPICGCAGTSQEMRAVSTAKQECTRQFQNYGRRERQSGERGEQCPRQCPINNNNTVAAPPTKATAPEYGTDRIFLCIRIEGT
jgi:hypothetical protein